MLRRAGACYKARVVTSDFTKLTELTDDYRIMLTLVIDKNLIVQRCGFIKAVVVVRI